MIKSGQKEKLNKSPLPPNLIKHLYFSWILNKCPGANLRIYDVWPQRV